MRFSNPRLHSRARHCSFNSSPPSALVRVIISGWVINSLEHQQLALGGTCAGESVEHRIGL